MVELLAPRAHEKGLEIAWTIEAGVPLAVAGDEARIRQILLNLIGNAVKFTDAGGVLIRLAASPVIADPSLRDRRLGIVLSIEDTGTGIAEADLPRLFSEFAQAERTMAGRKGGTGLGLAISRRLAQAMGGDITVTSLPGKGSTFRVELRLLEQPGAAVWGETPETTAKSARVLLAFDRKIERKAVADALGCHGVKVDAATFASATSRLHQTHPYTTRYDTVVVDASAGVEPAARLLEKLQALAAPDVTVRGIVLVDAATRALVPDFTARGFAGWTVRPVRPRSFVHLVTQGKPEATPEGEMPSPPQSRSETPPLQGTRAIRILLAEDDDVNALLGSCVLQKAGCLPTLVRTGSQAVDAVRAGIDNGEPDFDIILMDIIMPELGGIEATRAIQKLYAARASGPRLAPPVVALTANAYAEDRERYLAEGLDDYLAKPFDVAELQALLLRWSPRLRAKLAA